MMPNFRFVRAPLLLACIALHLPALVCAKQYLPPDRWMASLKADAPFIPYKLGLIDMESGTGGEWAEFSGDLRIALRDSNFFDKTAERRLRIQVGRAYTDVAADAERSVTTGNLNIVYRFLDGDKPVYEYRISTQYLLDNYSGSTDPRHSMKANLRLLLLNVRKEHADETFITTAAVLEEDIRKDLAGKGVGFSGLMTRGFIAGVEGTIGVVKGVGAVAGVALEVAASPEFQAAVNDAMAEQARQQAQQQAMLDQMRRDAEAAERQREMEERARRHEVAMRTQSNLQSSVQSAQTGNAGNSAQQQVDQRRIAEQQRVEAQRRQDEQQRLEQQRQEQQRQEQQRQEAQRKAEQDRIAAQRRKEEERKAAEARRGLGTPVQLATAPPIGTLSKDWSGWYRYGSHNNVDVHWRARLYDDGIRVQWRCSNNTSDKRYCSIGGDNTGNKIYHCYRGTTPVGRGGAMGEASDVRAGGEYQFMGETACNRMNATFLLPEVKISAVIPVW